MNYQRVYEYRFSKINPTSRQEVWKPISNYIFNKMGRPSHLLDPAAGGCEFISSVPAQERWAVDKTFPTGKNHIPGIKLIVSDIFEADLPSHYFNGIFISNLLEHLQTPEQVSQLLTKLYHCTKSGGCIAILGPNFKYCASEYFDCADHILALSHITVEEHLYAAGFKLHKTIPRFLPYSFRGKLPASPTLVQLYLQLPIFWPIIGKQFLLIAKKE